MAHFDIEAIDPHTHLVNVIIDTPKGSRAKYKYENKTGLLRLSKLLPVGACFPYNFGFVPSTSGEDGDALDMLVIMDEAVVTGCVISIHLIGVVQAEQTEKDGKTIRNDRLLGVVQTDYNPPAIHSFDDMDKHLLSEIEYFFIGYNRMHGRNFNPIGRAGSDKAMALIKEGIKRHQFR
jgi:inorganic pyrophosphatase